MEKTNHTLNVRAIPHEAWLRAKHNALESNIPFREYIIRLLIESRPFSLPTVHTTAQWKDLISDQ